MKLYHAEEVAAWSRVYAAALAAMGFSGFAIEGRAEAEADRCVEKIRTRCGWLAAEARRQEEPPVFVKGEL